MPHLPSASLRPSLLALAIVSTLPGVAFAAADEMTVPATGNARSAFEAPMMVSVIDATAPENQTASSAADLLRKVAGLCNNANQLAHVANRTGQASQQSVEEMTRLARTVWRAVKEQW